MREIEFRGLSVKREWCYGLLYKDLPNSTLYYQDYSYRIFWHPESGGQANCPVRNDTIGQFTGLTDKNGNKIFEKDVVYISGYGNYICEFPFLTLYEAATENDIGEILGNIFESPELNEN